MKTVQLILVNVHNCTETKPRRVSLTSQRFENDRVYFSYDGDEGGEGASTTDKAIYWLKAHGYTVEFMAEMPGRVMALGVDNPGHAFVSLKTAAKS